MRLLRRLARLATITALFGGTAALVAATSPAASAAPAAGPDGWVRIAHLSPQAPAMDMYVYPFGNPGRPIVLKDQMTTPAGKAVVRVLQASLKQHLVTVSYGPDVLARQLAYGAATSYTADSPGAQTVRFSAPGQDTAKPVTLAAGTVHTNVVLDDSTGLKVGAVTDAAGSQTMPKGAVSAGLGGTAPRPPANPAPWLMMIAAGVLLAAGGLARLRRTA